MANYSSVNIPELCEIEREASLLPIRNLIPLQIPELLPKLSRHALRAPSCLPSGH